MRTVRLDGHSLRHFWEKTRKFSAGLSSIDIGHEPIGWNGRIDDLDTEALTEQFAHQGYAVVRGPAQEIQTAYGALQNLLFSLGAPQGHERADMCGIAIVKAATGGMLAPHVFKGLSASALSHHTDGSYLCHVLPSGRVATPPDIILLQCVQPAAKGGDTELCDWQAIWNDLRASNRTFDRSVLKALQQPLFSAERPPLGHYAFSVFEKGPDEVLRVRWFDKLMYPDYLRPMMAAFKTQYLENPRYLKTVKMEAGDILVLNNGRLTHARTDFSEDPQRPRHYHRVFVDSGAGADLGTLQRYGRDLTMGDGHRYARLERPPVSPFSHEIVQAAPLSLPIGIRAQKTRPQRDYKLMLVSG